MSKLLKLIDQSYGWAVLFGGHKWTVFFPNTGAWFYDLCRSANPDHVLGRGQVIHLHVTTVCPEFPAGWSVLEAHESFRRVWVDKTGRLLEFCAEALEAVFGREDVPRFWIKATHADQEKQDVETGS